MTNSEAAEIIMRYWKFNDNQISQALKTALEALKTNKEEKPKTVFIQTSKGDHLRAGVVSEGRRENIPGVAEGSMAEHFLLSVDPDDEMGGW